MNTTETLKEIVRYGVGISQFDIDNQKTGLLTMDRHNELEKGASDCISSRN